MHSRSGFPTKYGLHTHLSLAGSQLAPTPQTTPSQRRLQRPLMQILGPAHGTSGEHTSGEHCPPGNGLPMNPSIHLQVGPS